MIERFDTGPRMSEMTIHNRVAYLAGQVPEDTSVSAMSRPGVSSYGGPARRSAESTSNSHASTPCSASQS